MQLWMWLWHRTEEAALFSNCRTVLSIFLLLWDVVKQQVGHGQIHI